MDVQVSSFVFEQIKPFKAARWTGPKASLLGVAHRVVVRNASCDEVSVCVGQAQQKKMLAVAIGAIPDNLCKSLYFDFELLCIEGRQLTPMDANFGKSSDFLDFCLLCEIQVREVFIELGVIAE